MNALLVWLFLVVFYVLLTVCYLKRCCVAGESEYSRIMKSPPDIDSHDFSRKVNILLLRFRDPAELSNVYFTDTIDVKGF